MFHHLKLVTVILSYLPFQEKSKFSCVNKEWQRASTNYVAITIDFADARDHVNSIFKFVGKRYNILKNMTLKLGPHRSPRGGWDNQFNVFGPDLRELFVKRATLLRSVTIVFNEDTKVENHEYVAKLGGFDAIPLLRKLTNLELTNVCL